jgi:tetrahydromethanopterin S-methyltransferase subunit B
MDYKHRKNKNEFFASRIERDIALSLPSSEELYDMVSKYVNIVFGFQFGKQKFSSFGLTRN